MRHRVISRGDTFRSIAGSGDRRWRFGSGDVGEGVIDAVASSTSCGVTEVATSTCTLRPASARVYIMQA